MSTNRESIIGKVRKLLAYDNATATEAEVSNAVALAQKLMTDYAIEQAEVDARATEPAREKARVDSAIPASRLSQWECWLHNAVRIAVPGVSCYQDSREVRKFDGSGGTAREIVLRWYGDAELAEIAAALYDETRSVIATMATGKFGGCYRGDGAQYATGFALELHKKATNQAREHAGASDIRAIVLRRDEENRDWLANTHGVRSLRSSSGSGSALKGSLSARAEGARDGRRYEMTPGKAKPRVGSASRKALPGS